MSTDSGKEPEAFEETRLGDVVDLLKSAIPELQVVYLFGSGARGNARSESDVDLAILSPRVLAGTARWNVQEELAAELHRDVDLIDLRAASTVMQMQVVSTGRVLYSSDPFVQASFEMRVYSAYALLNEERKEILEEIHRRGRVYGG